MKETEKKREKVRTKERQMDSTTKTARMMLKTAGENASVEEREWCDVRARMALGARIG